MPLPAALASRLAKRGILTSSQLKANEADNAVEEEVFAEDYDEQKAPPQRSTIRTNEDDVSGNQDEFQYTIKGYPGCPNKSSVYHDCTSYCSEKYGKGNTAPNAKYLRLKASLLQKYPLPEGWQEVFDPGTGRCYYWNRTSEMVSWLPPGHPNHTASKPAWVLRQEVKVSQQQDDEEDDSASDSDKSDDEDLKISLSTKKQEAFEKEHAKGRNKKRENDLDPMDPAAYSEAPRGTWSTGLLSDTKTGVDSTASGSLYQQRPLPSPGAVLRGRQKRP